MCFAMAAVLCVDLLPADLGILETVLANIRVSNISHDPEKPVTEIGRKRKLGSNLSSLQESEHGSARDWHQGICCRIPRYC